MWNSDEFGSIELHLGGNPSRHSMVSGVVRGAVWEWCPDLACIGVHPACLDGTRVLEGNHFVFRVWVSVEILLIKFDFLMESLVWENTSGRICFSDWRLFRI